MEIIIRFIYIYNCYLRNLPQAEDTFNVRVVIKAVIKKAYTDDFKPAIQ